MITNNNSHVIHTFRDTIPKAICKSDDIEVCDDLQAETFKATAWQLLGEKKASTVKRCVCVCVHVSVRVCFIFRDDSHALNSTHTQVEWEILRII